MYILTPAFGRLVNYGLLLGVGEETVGVSRLSVLPVEIKGRGGNPDVKSSTTGSIDTALLQRCGDFG